MQYTWWERIWLANFCELWQTIFMMMSLIFKFSFCRFSLKLVDLVLAVSNKLYFPINILWVNKMNYMKFHIESMVNQDELQKVRTNMNLVSCGLQT
jgi:hypothetical protein